ncbi:MAG: ferritin-like domain-containing protein [Candidatus Dormibacteraeota bacterium]|uniref:Ferritin-like domain-containing protein n=1 Tax=Candidatus Amunia macphersoniae TaxID=3127014 RepID=A0A934KJ90_9BACT|nr:ferritin-like domain-containing protein [Candidatus Dormibacteraeota bacterium]
MSLDDPRLVELSEAAQEESPERRRLLARSLAVAVAGAVGVSVAALFANAAVTTALADSIADVAILQTAASLENLAIAVYSNALTLAPSINGTDNPFVAKFLAMTLKQHADHLQAFNSAAQSLGGQPQTDLDHTMYSTVVTPALGSLKRPADVIDLVLMVEHITAQTYAKFAAAVGEVAALKPLASIAPVEAQHAAVLRAMQALLGGGAPQLITLPPDLTALPAAAGDVGFRQNSFYPTSGARSASEGTVASVPPRASGTTS